VYVLIEYITTCTSFHYGVFCIAYKNIAAIVEKYHGECYMESIAENGEVLFQISVAIPTAKG
jgi:hypothetical protein